MNFGRSNTNSRVSNAYVSGYIPASDNDQEHDLKDKIINLQKIQKHLKTSLIQTDVALKSPSIQYRESILQTTFNKQKTQFQDFLLQYKSLDSAQRRPYEKMLRKFKQKITEHQQQIRMVSENPQQYKKKLELQRQVWFQNQQVQQQQWKFLLRGFVGIFGAFLFHICIGAISRWSFLNNYVTSFYKLTTDPHLETRKNSFTGPLTMFCMGITMKWGFRMCQKLGAMKILIPGVIGLATAIFLTTFMDEFLEFVAFNNVMYGLFAGAIFLCPMKECHKYFPKYRLICNSIILTGTGLGGVFFGLLNTKCLNPTTQKPADTTYFSGQKSYIAARVPMCMMQMSIVVGVVGLLALIAIFPMIRYNSKQQQIKLQKGELPDFQNSCYTQQQALKSQVFWVLIIIVMTCTMGNYYVIMNHKNTIKAEKDPIFKNDDYILLIIISGALSNSFSRLFWGLTFRNIGFKFTFLIAVSINIVMFVLFMVIELTEYTYLALYICVCIAFGGYMVIMPNTCLLVYGDVIGQSIYGFYFAAYALTNFLQYLISSNMAEFANWVKNNINSNWAPTNPYKLMFFPFAILCVIPFILVLVIKFQGRWENSLKLLSLKCQ